MGFQKVVTTMPAAGIPGQQVAPGQAVYTSFNYVSDGTVEAGTFAYAKALTETGFAEMNAASSKGSAGAAVLGFVERVQVAVIPSPLEEATAVYPAGTGLSIAIRGQFYAKATGTATEGQSVLCDPTTGAITYGTAGTANDTGWVVRFPRGVHQVAKDDLVIYECFGLTVGGGAAAASYVGEATVGEAEVG